MCNNREFAKFLRKNSAYSRLMRELRKKWESYGKVAGAVTLKKTSEEERKAIGGIVGKKFTDETVRITFREFEQGMQKTCYAPLDVKNVIEAYFDISLISNKEKKAKIQREKDEFFDRLVLEFKESDVETSVVSSWLNEMRCNKKCGYHTLMKVFNQNRETAFSLARNVGKALSSLERTSEEEKLLAVFAASISGNPHYFDRGTTEAQLLTHAICFWKDCEEPRNAYEWRECMERAGLVSDTIASMVHVFGAHLETGEGIHSGYESFYNRREPYVLTAENLKSITGAAADNNRVYVVENEMVFLYIVNNVKMQDVTLLCTSGQLRVAAFQLLTRFIESGAVIYYSGDIDPEGMDIAERLWEHYGDAIRMWHMDVEDYYKSVSSEALSEQQLVKMSNFKNNTLCRTAECVREKKLAGYQEHLLDELLEDIKQQKCDWRTSSVSDNR